MHCNLRNYLLKKLIKETTLFGAQFLHNEEI